jgi:hypothetical protein
MAMGSRLHGLVRRWGIARMSWLPGWPDPECTCDQERGFDVSSITLLSNKNGAISRRAAAVRRAGLRCSTCGLEVASDRALSPFPLCRDMNWRPASLRAARPGLPTLSGETGEGVAVR